MYNAEYKYSGIAWRGDDSFKELIGNEVSTKENLLFYYFLTFCCTIECIGVFVC